MPRKILIVDDQEMNRLLLQNTLSVDYETLEAADGREALKTMLREHETLSAVLLDILMPEMDGYEVLRRARNDARLSQIPIIMVTGSEDEESRVKALSLGANDFIVKPFNPEIIKHCVKNTIALRETASTLKAMQRDKLTGLYNREAFFEQVSAMVAEHKPGYYLLSAFDIDNFKLINDQYGAVEGDRILREIGRAVTEDMEFVGGVAGRISADNFAVLIPHTSRGLSVTRFVQQNRWAFSDKQAIVFSVGRYLVSDLSLPASSLYDRAYIAKQSVKGRYDEHIAYFDDTMLDKLVRAQQIIADMDAAIAKRQFEIWFQPQRNHSTGALVGAEALVRWRHPERGLIPPNEFIPIFEQNGFIYELDKYVWEEACRVLRGWLDDGAVAAPVSVNVSRYDIFRPDFIDVLAELIRKYRIPVELLRLEITESAFAQSTKQIVQIIRQLIAKGFIIEIDDFGSGYSSLNTLKSVPAQVLKLDMRFLQDDDGAERTGNILESIVRMAKWMGMSVIAEGVEEKRQADYLASIGCNYIQGYYYARPMPVADYETYCRGICQEEKLLSMETVANLDNNAFWNPKSMDTLIFNSYVGAACIFEYDNGDIELLRVNAKFTAILGNGTMSAEETLRLNWISCLAPESRALVREILRHSAETGEEQTREYEFLNIPGAPEKTYLRATMRVIATAGKRMLVYCMSENITAQRAAEENERRAELKNAIVASRLQAIMDNVDVGIVASVIRDGKSEVLFSNNKYYQMLGYTRAQYEAEVDDPFCTFVLENREEQRGMVLDLIRKEETGALECRMRCRDGSERVFRDSISTCRFADIDESVQLSIFRDVTAEKQSERILLETDEQLRFLNAMAHELLAQPDTDEGIHAALNKLAAYFQGKRACIFEFDFEKQIAANTYEACDESVCGEKEPLREIPLARLTPWLDAFEKRGCYVIENISAPDESRAAEKERLQKLGVTSLFVAPLKRDGKIIGMLGVGDPRRQLGHVDRLMALCDYIAVMLTRRDLEARISEDNKALAGLMRDMPGGFVRMRVFADRSVDPVFVNEGFLRLTGMTRAELKALYGGGVLAGVHPDDVVAVRESVAKMIRDGKAHSNRYRLRHKNGGYIWLSTFGRVATDANGEIILNTYYTDAGEQVKDEEMLKNILDNLPCGAALYEFDGINLRVIHSNKRYWELVDRAPSDNSERPALLPVHPEDRDMIYRELQCAISQGRVAAADIRILCGKDEYRPFHATGRIIPQADGHYLVNAIYSPISDEAMSIQEMLPVALQSVMDFSPELSFVKGKDLRYICTSRKFAVFAGKKDEKELLGKTTYDAFPPEIAARYDATDRAILAGDLPHVESDSVLLLDGETRHFVFSKYPLLDSKGNVLGVYGTGRDVTEARETKSYLELLNNNIPGGIAVYEGVPDALDQVKMTYFSDGLCRILGFPREEFAGLMAQNPFCLIADADAAKMFESIAALVRDGTPIDYIYRARTREGAYKWVNVRAVMGEPNGGRLTVNAVFFDVTEQKIASEKLRMSEEVNRLAIEQSRDVVCRYDIAAKRLMVPASVNAIYESDVLQQDVPDKMVRDGKISPDTAEAYFAFYESIARGDKSGQARFQRSSTLGWRWLEAHFTTIFSDGGEPVTAVISFLDVTESVEKDAAYQKWRQSLRDRQPESYSLHRCNISRDIAMETAEGQLVPPSACASAPSMSARALCYADTLVFTEDRELFLSFTDRDALLLRYSQGRRTDALEYREKLPDGGVRWLRLTVDFMDSPYSEDVEASLLFENIDETKRAELKILERAETDPLTGVYNRATFAAKVDQLMETRCMSEISALFIIDLDGFKQVNDSFGHATGDETLIEMGQKLRGTFREQDLVCRLGGDEFMVYMYNVPHANAAKERAALVCALLHKSFSMEVQLSASVGIAVFPEDGDSFEALYRKADLALYHVKAKGKDGYAFYTEAMNEQKALPEKTETEAIGYAAASRAAPKRRMLIVEDNEINRDYLTSLFDREFLVDTAAEGTAALIRLRRYGSGISVVLLDLMMPGLDGFAVLKKMRESVVMQSIPVVVVSGMSERETCLEAIRNGASDFITKPVDADLLRLRVASAVSKAENEQLRAQNRYLAIQNDEVKRLAEAKRNSEELSLALHAAERADLAKSQFLSSMSHEIRTPLNAVIGYNAIARGEMSEARTDEERRRASMKVMDCLTKSEVASRHLLTIINDVLDMSAIESGKMKVDESPFDFRSLISSLTVMFFSQARAKGVNFEVHFEKPTEEWLVGDPLRINQVLTNLLSNAVKFTPEGGSVTLTITEKAVDENATGFSFVVSDTGIGMTQEYLEHIWTPFEQAEASISRRFGGTGLGLSITKNLVDLMKGDISVESESGVGSKFTVNLTFSRMEQPVKTANYDFSNLNALVVDDDASTCDYIKLLFDRCGARCSTFTSGRMAVDAFAAAKESGEPFNVCLVDWRMPHMDGFATISEIRRIAAQKLPIVVVTAYDFGEVADQAEKLGISKFVSKPLFQSSLFDLLATIGGKTVPPASESNPKYDFEGARVLLAEDNNMNMEVARHILLSAHMAVDSAWNGQEAFDIFEASREGTYKAILMDVHMPEVDGYQATRMIRASKHPDAGRIPIIAMTADVFAEDIAAAHNAGMNDHIAKPIDVDGLFAKLAKVVEAENA